MRARLRYAALSPRTPQLLAQRVTEALGLLAAVAGILLVVSGIPGQLYAQLILSLGGVA